MIFDIYGNVLVTSANVILSWKSGGCVWSKL